MSLNRKDLAARTAEAVTKLQGDISTLENRSEDALKTFRTTLNNLESINVEIDEKVEMIESHVNEFTTLRDQLLSKRHGNEKVSTKIREFLS